MLQISYSLNDNGQVWLEQAVLKAACVRLDFSPLCGPYFEELACIHEDQFIRQHWPTAIRQNGRYNSV